MSRRSPRASREAEDDARWMARALALAERGLGRTWPNPPVGAVFVRGGRVVGEGFHHRAGAPHAEIEALRQAGERARGADLYVTLEPCSHHGRTPPCVGALRPLGLRRVVVAVADPNPRVRGRGLRALRQAGVAVETGVGAEQANALLAGYRSLVLRGRPQVVLKLAVSLDGRLALPGRFAWLTGPAARRRGRALRGIADAVLVGAATVRVDDPQLTARTRGRPDPVRIVVCGPRLALPGRAQVLRPGGPPTWVVAPAGAEARRVEALRRRGVEVLLLPARGERVPFDRVVRALGARGLTRVLVEGGGEVAAEALRARVVDEVALFVAPRLLGADAVPALGALGLRALAGSARLAGMAVEPVGGDLLVTGRVRYAG